MPMFLLFSRACRHHSTISLRNGGAFDTVFPLVCKWGQLPPLPPGSDAYGFGILRQIRSIRRSLSALNVDDTHLQFHHVEAWYCNVVLVGLTRCELDRLQSVINAAARLTVGAQHYDHISPLLVDLHRLRMVERIQYKLCVLVYRCLHGSAPCYLQQTVCPVASMESRRRLHAVSHIIRPDGACYSKVNTAGWLTVPSL